MAKRKKREDTAENWSYKNDYPVEQVWNTYHYLSRLIEPRLRAFKSLNKHGTCSESMTTREWNQTIEKMIRAFELTKYSAFPAQEELQEIKGGLELFSKYYLDLWD